MLNDQRTTNTHRTRIFSDSDVQRMLEIVEKDPTIFLDELQHQMFTETNKYADVSTIAKYLKRAGVSKKKVQRLHSNRDVVAQARYLHVAAQHRFDEFVWMDETGSQVRHSIRRFGWGKVNTRVRIRLPKINGKRYSLAACMSYRGAGPARLVEGSVNRLVFLKYMQEKLLPAMNPHYDEHGNRTGLPLSVLVMDNCATHK